MCFAKCCAGQHDGKKEAGRASAAGVAGDWNASGQAAEGGRARRASGPRAQMIHSAMGGGELAAEMLLPLCCPITKVGSPVSLCVTSLPHSYICDCPVLYRLVLHVKDPHSHSLRQMSV